MSKTSDTALHELCKGFGALLSRSKVCTIENDMYKTNIYHLMYFIKTHAIFK